MPFLKQVTNELRLLLSTMEMATDRGHHLGAIPRPTFPEGIRLDILIEQLVGIELGTIARQLNEPNLGRMCGDERLRDAGAMDGMTIDNEIHFPRTLLVQPPHEVHEHRRAERAVKDAKRELAAIRDRGKYYSRIVGPSRG